MKITVAKDAGYCFGVRDAVNLAYDTAEKYGGVYMLGDIVHNEKVVDDLNNSGAKIVDNLGDIPDSSPVLFRAHGTKKDVWRKAKERNIIVNYPSKATVDIILIETASFTCSLIFQMLFSIIGTVNPWKKTPRLQISEKRLLPYKKKY